MPRIAVLKKPARRQLEIRGVLYVVTLYPNGDVALRRWKGRKAVRTGIFRALAGELDQLELGLTREVAPHRAPADATPKEAPRA